MNRAADSSARAAPAQAQVRPAGAALPQPDAAALEASAALADRIAGRVASAGGWIGFDAFMHEALYAPGLGYYANPLGKFGAAGDFVTAPTLTPLFGATVARQLAQWFGADGFEPTGLAPRVLEFGAGDGNLAADVIAGLAEAGLRLERYDIVELSADLRERQRARIAARVPEAIDRVCWLDRLPDRFDGVLLANEVLDAMPVRLARVLGRQVLERGVALEEGRVVVADRPAGPALTEQVHALLAEAGWTADEDTDYLMEIGEQAAAWVRAVGERLARGALLLFDYGFPRAELYHPQRAGGTVMCHFRHRAHGDWLLYPGLQDITAHVDFSAVLEAGREAGLAPAGYTSQARFLMNAGILDLLGRIPAEDVARFAPQAHAVQRLLAESEMGELFKAIAFTRGLPPDAIGFARGDRPC